MRNSVAKSFYLENVERDKRERENKYQKTQVSTLERESNEYILYYIETQPMKDTTLWRTQCWINNWNFQELYHLGFWGSGVTKKSLKLWQFFHIIIIIFGSLNIFSGWEELYDRFFIFELENLLKSHLGFSTCLPKIIIRSTYLFTAWNKKHIMSECTYMPLNSSNIFNSKLPNQAKVEQVE